MLPTFPESLPTKAQRHLESLGVKVHTNTRVTSVDVDGIVAGGQRIVRARCCGEPVCWPHQQVVG